MDETTHDYLVTLDEGKPMIIKAIDILEANRLAKQTFGSHVVSVDRVEMSRPTKKPVLEAPAFEDYQCRYVCGTCGSDTYDLWSAHQAHYTAHQEA